MEDFVDVNTRAVEGAHGVVVAANVGAGDGKAGKDAFGARVCEDFGIELPISIGRGVAAYGTGSGGGVGANLELAGEHVLHAAIALDDHDKIDAFNAYLKSPIHAGDGEECRGAPTLTGAAGSYATTTFGAEHESAFDHVGHDGDAFRVIEHFFRDASIRSGHDLVKDLTGVREAVVCRFKRGVGPTESSQTQERN